MDFIKKMRSLPHEFSPAAFWFWYGDLDPERMREQIRLMTRQGVWNGFMHARAYLKTPYLGDGWWDAVDACVDEGKKTGFYPWLYDEYAWPSGTAGSIFAYGYQAFSPILAKGETNSAKYLIYKHYDNLAAYQKDQTEVPYRLFCGGPDAWKPVLDLTEAQGEIIAFFVRFSKTRVDYMKKETIRDFVDSTHEEYKKRYGEEFGKQIPGIFFDEIYMHPFHCPWTEAFPDRFLQLHGYDLLDHLPALVYAGGAKERQIRRDYFATVTNLYEEAFFQQISHWCTENHLQLTGHTEEWLHLHPNRQGNYFDTIRHLHIPGADCHDYRYRFPRRITYREPKFAVSVARANGKARAMSEALGGAGWNCPLQEFKRGINTLGAMGISMLILHGFHSECEGQGSQSDWPNSFFFQNPYWRYFHHFADYMNRICFMNAQGVPVVDVGLYYPIAEMQMERLSDGITPDGMALDEGFNAALVCLIENQIDTDMIDSRGLLSATVQDGRLRVGSQSFRLLVCPDTMEPSAALQTVLDAFVSDGGKLLYYRSGRPVHPEAIPADQLPQAVSTLFQPDVTVLRGAKNDLFVNHRMVENTHLYMIASTSSAPKHLTLLLRESGTVQKISPEDGSVSGVCSRICPKGTEVTLTLGPDEACWLLVSDKPALGEVQSSVLEELAVGGRWEFLPLSKDCQGQAQLSAQCTQLRIPQAFFSSDLHPAAQQIRIQNTADTPGACGRHLSLWEANWITHRPAGIDNSCQKHLFFRRSFHLNGNATAARICIAAVNQWTLYVNGQLVSTCENGQEPTTVDIKNFLNPGENVIAIAVYNPTPLENYNLFTVEAFPKEILTSLLAQAEITAGGETMTLCTDKTWLVNIQTEPDWISPAFSPEGQEIDASADQVWENPDYHEGDWLYAWERGRPPLSPWGDLPLFGKPLTYPQRVCYSITLPAGTARVFYPSLSGTEVSITLDGMPVTWTDGICACKPDGLPHNLQIRLTANRETDGLLEALRVEAVPFRTALCDWRLHGLAWYSGFARYRNKFHLNKKAGRYILQLWQTAFYCEVWVNGKPAGERVWEPYALDITDFLQDGGNDIAIIVANSAAVERQFMLVDEGMALGWNRYWNEDTIQREGDRMLSGLIGPVRLLWKQ